MFAGARTHTHTVARVKQSHKFKLDFMSAVSGSCQQPFISKFHSVKVVKFYLFKIQRFCQLIHFQYNEHLHDCVLRVPESVHVRTRFGCGIDICTETKRKEKKLKTRKNTPNNKMETAISNRRLILAE